MTGATGACEGWREALSADADGEDPGVDPRLLDAHLAHCVACRAWRHGLDAGRRQDLVAAAPDVPDLSAAVIARAREADRAGRPVVARGLLVVVAVQIAVLAVPSLLDGRDGGVGHDARHLGAFSVAYAVALLVVAARPARTRTLLPVACVLAGTLALTAAVDVAAGRVPFDGEVIRHLPEALSVLLVWRLAGDPLRPTGARGTGPTDIAPRGRATDRGTPHPSLRRRRSAG